ncbi:MAG: hypothetical protein JWQ14_2404 [Adhaeribacter sp.]|nr:hypothetical protein [Adhaeribacter sp.]
MNIYSYNWWEVLIFLIILELAGALTAYLLMQVWAGRYFKGGWRKKKSVSTSGRKRRE